MLDAEGHKNDREDMDLAFEEPCNNQIARLKKKKKVDVSALVAENLPEIFRFIVCLN